MTRDIRRVIRLAKFDRSDLSRYADRLGAGKGAVEKDFLISTFLLLMSYDNQLAPFTEKMVFRGGSCIKRAYYPDETRFSEDLDFTSLTVNEMNAFLKALEDFGGQDLGVTTVTQVRKTYEDSKGLDIRLDYISILGQPTHIMFNLSTSTTLRNAKRMSIAVMPYFTSFRPVIRVMDVKEILAEKLRALLQRVKPRDVFDIWFLARKKRMRIDHAMLKQKLIQSYEAAPLEKKESAAFYSHVDVINRMKGITEMAWKRELGGLLIGNSPSREIMVDDVSEIVKRIGDIRLVPTR